MVLRLDLRTGLMTFGCWSLRCTKLICDIFSCLISCFGIFEFVELLCTSALRLGGWCDAGCAAFWEADALTCSFGLAFYLEVFRAAVLLVGGWASLFIS